MHDDSITVRIERVGRFLGRRQAALWLTVGLAAVLTILWLLGIVDVIFRLGRAGRLVAWAVLIAPVGPAAFRIVGALRRRYSSEGLAAIIERSFPQLDNRLINHVQFSAEAGDDPFKKAYLEQGVPELGRVDPQRMVNRTAQRRALAALGVAFLLVVAPHALMGRQWSAALRRVVNPFSDCRPVGFTKVIAVEPGDASIRRGEPLTMKCTVHGRKGHHVRLDIEMAGDTVTTCDLGRLQSGDTLEFSHTEPEVNTDMRYRFRAGDDPCPRWYSVTARPPPAFSAVTLTVRPPAYTRLRPRRFDGITDAVEVPVSSEIDLVVQCNMPAASVHIADKTGAEVLSLSPSDDPCVWHGTLRTNLDDVIVVSALNTYGERTDLRVGATLLPDMPPTVLITSPEGRALLTSGMTPAIGFTALDDYGLATVTVERVTGVSAADTAAEQVAAWPAGGARRVDRNWRSDVPPAESLQSSAFLVTVKDNCPLADHTVRSPLVVFERIAADAAAGEAQAQDEKVASLLAEITEMQRTNLVYTGMLGQAAEVSAAEHWARAAGTQTTIRRLTRDLLAAPREPLGGLSAMVRALYMEEMLEVVAKLTRVPLVEPAGRSDLARDCILLEERILRKLASASVAADRVRHNRAAAGLLSMIDGLVKGEAAVVAATKKCADEATGAGTALVKEQDDLAGDVGDFVKACRRESSILEAHDMNFAALITKVADTCETARIRPGMLKAAEHLENNAPKSALPIEESVLAGLTGLRDMLNEWHAAETEQYAAEMAEALAETKDRLEKIRKLQSAVVDAMRLAETQKDRSDEERDLFEEELEEMEANIREALLEIPRDLHIFPELSVANELVEDVYSVFEEVRQLEGSENMTAADAEEWGVLKPEALLEEMAKAEGRIDDMEMWLAEKPDLIEYNMEAFDREEMPQMALGALPAAIEDIIGELLEESPELAEAADDSATNQGMPEPPPPGWEVAEGPIESFGAQGKSGNQVPDHKEQSGRSIVGRQGQAFGETAAGSGTISEGDGNIENRITPDPLQSGQVQVDGEADETATGGGKQASGAADAEGMSGAGSNRRMDSTAEGSTKGLEALMARTQSIHTRASLMNMRTGSLSAAAHHMRQAADAIAAGLPIEQVREHRRLAVTALVRARTELSAGVSGALDRGQSAAPLEDSIEGGPENAPEEYRDLVAEYYKSLSNDL